MIPKKVKVGWRTYKIEIVDDIDNGDDQEYFALINYKSLLIQISSAITYEEQKAALFHELVHAIFYQAGQNELRENENATECIASGIMGLLKNNPNLFNN